MKLKDTCSLEGKLWQTYCVLNCSVMSHFGNPQGLSPASLFCPWDSLGTTTGVGGHSLLQGIFPTLELNLGLLIAGRFFTIWATREAHGKPRQYIKKQRHYFANKGPSSQSYGFSSSHGQMWKLDHEDSWAPKNWCFQIVALENALQSPLDCKENKPVNPKGNQPWIFTGRTDTEAETPFGHLMRRADSGKNSDAGQDWRQKEKGTTEDEMPLSLMIMNKIMVIQKIILQPQMKII